ncbi:MAG TPA: tetratricopeptide repeat protein, partial [Beijerinckiaceae bacterium]|nr:tetratricopeptide repeat protein [Beijerinckiaceae bacterium]
AERLLGREPMTLLLKAQAAQLAGDRPAAEQAFSRMLETDETRLLGLRGLFVEARRTGNDAARSFAEQAYRLAPATPWAAEALLDYRSGEKDWSGARAIVDDSASRRLVDREVSKRQKAALLTAEAIDLKEQSPDQAFQRATEALKLNPALVPAAALVAQRLIARGETTKAARVLESAWKQEPHPDLAEAYLGVRYGDSAHDKLKRARHLAKLTPGAREARLTLAAALLDAREFDEARKELEALVLDQPSVRVCHLMAELEDKESGHIGMVRKWLARAAQAPRDPAWVADGFVSESWQPVSPVTGRLDAFRWTTPPQSIESKLRASIDADRLIASARSRDDHAKPTAPAALQAPGPVPAAPQPAAAEPVILPDAVAAEAEALALEPPEQRPPDDPGPRKPEPKARKGWRLFS